MKEAATRLQLWKPAATVRTLSDDVNSQAHLPQPVLTVEDMHAISWLAAVI
jgi:hypothetical protein